MVIVLVSFLSLFSITATDQPAAQAAAPRIVVIGGEDAVNIIQQKTAVAPLIEVRDRNNLPVAGVAVTFTVGGQGASFGGLTTLTVTTNAAGQAAAVGLTPTAAGAIQINATALVQGQALTATITQTNVLTAAQAASAAGATGGAGAGGGSTGATSGAASGAAGGGGGLSATTIGIVGAAVAGGAVAATQVVGGGTREVAGNFTYEMTLTFGPCVRVERYTGLLALEFDSLDDDPLSGKATIEDGRVDVLSTTAACTSGPQPGNSGAFGMNPTPVGGPKSNITFNFTETTPAATTTLSFVGSLSGETVTGTLKHGIRIDNGANGITTGNATVTVTLTPH
jgi:hypothetical protein